MPFSRCRRSENTFTVLQNSLDKGVPDIGVLCASAIQRFSGSDLLRCTHSTGITLPHVGLPLLFNQLEHLNFIPLVKSSK